MKIALLFALGYQAFSLPAVAANQICGQIEAKDSANADFVSLVNRVTYAGRQQTFLIENPAAFAWTAGDCICVKGTAGYDPEYGQDFLHMTLTVEQKISQDSSGQSCEAGVAR